MTFYETAKLAIAAALQAVDANMRVYDYMLHPISTNSREMLELFGEKDSHGVFILDANKKAKVNAARFTRRYPGPAGDPFATGGNLVSRQDEVRFQESGFLIELVGSVQQPINDGTGVVTEPSEYAFQNKVDAATRQLYLNSSIRALMKSQWNATVVSVSADEVWFTDDIAESRCHLAQITLTIRHQISNFIST